MQRMNHVSWLILGVARDAAHLTEEVAMGCAGKPPARVHRQREQ